MNAQTPIVADVPSEAPRSRWGGRWLRWVLGVVVALLLAAAGAVIFIDSGAGHRLIVDRIAALQLKNGLRIRIGRIEGSIFGQARLRDLRLYDDRGLFLSSPVVELDWNPTAYLYNELWIDRLEADLVTLARLPKFRPSEAEGPILPDLDIHVGRLDIKRLAIGAAVTGRPRAGRVAGTADIRAGRALVDLRALVADGGDRLTLRLDAQPDADRFDVDLRVVAPADSVAGAIVGTRLPFQLQVAGDGLWSRWRGAALLDVSGTRSADLQLTAERGRYRIAGLVSPDAFLTGRVKALAAPRLQVDARGTFEQRVLDGRVSLRSAALRVEAAGAVDLATSQYRRVAIGVDVLDPKVLLPSLRAEKLRLTALLDGAFARARFAYRITSPRAQIDTTGLQDVRIEGRGQLSPAPVRVPILFQARRVTGVGEEAGGLLQNLRIQGVLNVTSRTVTAQNLALSSDKLAGKLTLLFDFLSGRYDVALSGSIARYGIPGLGIVDVSSEVTIVRGPDGRPRLVGVGRANVRRLDNAFFRNLAGGLPRIETNFARGADGVIRFTNLRLVSPRLRASGNGFRRTNGTFFFEGSGRQAEYGPFAIRLDGPISRPRVDLRLARPNDAAGLRDVRLSLVPNATGFAYSAAGGSTLGPFSSEGQILLPPGGATSFQIARLDVSGTRLAGTLRSDPGGFTGRLSVNGGGLNGELLLRPQNGVQRIEAHLVANNARFAGPPPISIASGRVDGVVLLTPGALSVDATVTAQGLQRGDFKLESLSANARMRGGAGQVRATFAGTRGRAFQFQTVADVTPNQVRVSGRGVIDNRPIALTNQAVLTRAEGGWRLAPTTLTFNGGSATVSGLFGAARTEVDARLRNVRLNTLDVFYPDLGLGGVANGTFRYAEARGSGTPTGRADLKIRGLTRAGLVLSSKPIDLGIAAALDGRNAAMRAVAVSDNQVIGRAQARLSPLGTSGSITERLLRAPLRAQLRYAGTADTLWRLTGIELLDLSGPVQVAADAGGTLGDPQIRGAVRSRAARLESPITGTVITDLAINGRFGGSRLILDSFAGKTPGNGTVTGRGSFDLAAANGFGIDLAIQATRARLLDRDDISGSVTGPLTIRSDGAGGTIAGKLRLDRGRFTPGAAAAETAIPRLNMREVGPVARPIVLAGRPPLPWNLDIDIDARNRLEVTGLGLDSEWGLNVKVTGPIDAFALTGRADFIRGGYEFAGKRFDIERGVIRFTGTSPVDPILDILAESRLQGLTAQVRVTGTGNRPEIAFTSVPVLPQEELLSRLLFGTSIVNLSAPEALQLAASVAALNGGSGGINPMNALRRAIGLDRLRFVPGDVTTGQRTAVAAGKYITRKVYVEILTDGAGYSATRIEYQITRFLSILGTISTLGRTGANVRISRDY